MAIIERARILVGLAFLGATAVAMSEVPRADSVATAATPETVVVVGTAESGWNCNETTAERARLLADKASQDGAYQRAGECYLAAGEQALADQAFVKAIAQTSADTSRKLAANLDEVKAQARQMKQAFHHR